MSARPLGCFGQGVVWQFANSHSRLDSMLEWIFIRTFGKHQKIPVIRLGRRALVAPPAAIFSFVSRTPPLGVLGAATCMSAKHKFQREMINLF